MQHLTQNGLRLAARLTMTNSAKRVSTKMRAVSTELATCTAALDTEWMQPMKMAFDRAARLQTSRDPGTAAAMLDVFATVHRFMQRGLGPMESSDFRLRRRSERLRAAARRLALAIRASVITLHCTRAPMPVDAPRNIEEMGLEVLDEEMDDDHAVQPAPPTRPADRTFVARMADLLSEKRKKTVTADEKRRAIAVCRRQREDIAVHIARWTDLGSTLSQHADRIERLATATADLIDAARVAGAHQQRANVLY